MGEASTKGLAVTGGRVVTFCYLLFFSSTVWASAFKSQESVSLTHYLQVYLSHDEELKNFDLRSQVAQSQLEKAQDLYQSQLTLEPLQTHTERNSPTLPYERVTRIGANLTQKLASGTSLRLGTNRYLESSVSSLLEVSGDYSLSIHQELLKNSFGSLDREVRNRAASNFKLSQLQYQNQMLKSCYKGMKIFINAYSSQQNLIIFEEMLKDSDRTLQFSEKAYEKRMLRKIDILSARADNLRIQSQKLQAQKEHKNKMSSLTHPISENKVFFKLENPSQIFLRWKLGAKKKPLQLLTYKEQEQKVLSSESTLKISKNSARHQLGLEFTMGRREGAFQRIGKALDEDYINLSLTMGWPIFNKTRKAIVAEARYERDIAIYNRQRMAEELSEQQDYLSEELKSSRERLQISRQKIKLYRQQIKEAKRLLRAGKLEFEDYIRYRDIYLSERVQSISFQNESWNKKAQWAWLQNNFTLLCRGGSS